MTLHDKYRLTPVINAAGTFTPLGVSRSASAVREATAEALGSFFIMDELQDAASLALARFSGAEAGCVTHCASAAITLAVAAAMAGDAPEHVAALPDATGMPLRVVLPTGHAVNYGHPIVQDIRLAGAVPVLAGTEAECGIADVEREIAHPETACLLLVCSRLTRGAPVGLAEAVAAARRRGVPAIIDGAAQDLRVRELLATGADLVLLSAQKYLAAPTAGAVVGRRALVDAVRAQEKGIGRAMKATKEAICGVLAAIEERERMDLPAWREAQERKVAAFVARASRLRGVTAHATPDPTGMPFARVTLLIDEGAASYSARELADMLKASTPSIWAMAHRLDVGEIVFELVQLSEVEAETILKRLAALL